MNKLAQLRNIIASLDETLVKAFCGRALFKVNAELYNELKRGRSRSPRPPRSSARRRRSRGAPTSCGRST